MRNSHSLKHSPQSMKISLMVSERDWEQGWERGEILSHPIFLCFGAFPHFPNLLLFRREILAFHLPWQDLNTGSPCTTDRKK